MNSERHLLLGLLAFQNGFITQPQLLVAFGTWVSDKSRGLADYLTEQKALSTEVVAALERMVDLHLIRFGGDPEKSLANLSISGSSLRTELEQMAKGDNQALHTISFLAPASPSSSSASEDKYGTVGVRLSNRSATNLDSAQSPGIDSQRFRIVHEHAKGGLGVVFVAEDKQLHREVAVKQIREDRADMEEYRAKFEQEAQITGQLEHPGIVPIYALGTNDAGRPYYAMRFIRGEDLQSRIRKFHAERKDKKTPFDGPELRGLLRRFVDVCNAIDYAHDRGVLHRDLKPGNVMLGKHGETLVVDWGLAKATSAKPELDPYATMGPLSELPISKAETGSGSETRYGQFIGTPAYAPPEQILGQLDKLGPASDVYSLGAILYELLTGKVPITGKTLEELIRKSTTGDYPSPRMLTGEVLRPLDAICRKAMSLKTEDRFPSAKLLRDEVERWLNDEPVATYSESIFERGIRLSKRHKSATLVAGIGLVLLSLFLASGIWISQQQAEALRLESAKTSLEAAKTSMQLARSYHEAGNPFDAAKEIERAIELSKSETDATPGKELLLFARLTQGGRSQCPPIVFDTAVNAVEFSPDGATLAIASGISIRFWDVASGLPLGNPIIHRDTVRKIAFSRDGTILAVAAGKTLSLFSVKGGSLIDQYQHVQLIDDFVFCLDEKSIITVAGESICTLEFSNKVTLLMQSRFDNRVTRLANPDWPDWRVRSLFESQLNSTGDVLITSAPDGSVRVWSAATGQRIGNPILHSDATKQKTMDGISGTVSGVEFGFSPSGAQFFTATYWPIVWNSHSGNESRIALPKQFIRDVAKRDRDVYVSFGVQQTTISPDDRFILTQESSSLLIWTLPARELHREIGKDLVDIHHTAFSPDGKFVAVANHKNCSIWDVTTGRLSGPPIRHEGVVKRVAFSPTGTHLATICDDRSVHVWRTTTETAHFQKVVANTNDRLRYHGSFQSLLQIPRSNRFATLHGAGVGSSDRYSGEAGIASQFAKYADRVDVWTGMKSATGSLLFGIESTVGENWIQFQTKIEAMACSPDGKLLAVGIQGEGVKILNVDTGDLVCGPLTQDESDRKQINCIAFRPDSKKIVVVTSDPKAKVWDLHSGKPEGDGFNGPSIHGRGMMSGRTNYWVEYNMDGRLIAIASMQGVQLYDSTTFQLVGEPMMHGDPVERFMFSPDGSRIVTFGTGVAKFWNANNGKSLGVDLNHAGIKRVAFDQTGLRIATVGNNKLQLWECRSGERLGAEVQFEGGNEDFCILDNGASFLAIVGDKHNSQRIELWDFDEAPIPKSKKDWIDLYRGISLKPNQSIEVESERKYATLGNDSQWLDSTRERFTKAVQREVRKAALDAENHHQWFAALVHLNNLRKWFPNDSELNDRVITATKFLPDWVTDASALKAEREKKWKSAVPLLETMSSKFADDEEIAKRLVNARQQKELSELSTLIDESNFERVVAILRESFWKRVNEEGSYDFRDLFPYACSLVEFGTVDSINEANELLIRSCAQHEWKSWQIATGFCILKTPHESFDKSLSLLDELSEDLRSKNQRLKGWILAQRGRYEEAIQLLQDRTDFVSRYFKTVSFKGSGQEEKARIEQRLAMLEFDKEWSNEVNGSSSTWENKHAAASILKHLEWLFTKDVDNWKIDQDASIWERLFEWKAALPLLEELSKTYPTDQSIQERITSVKKNLQSE